MNPRFILAATCLSLGIAGCSSDTSDFDSGPSVNIVEPIDDQQFRPGDRVSLTIETTNFELGPPNEEPHEEHEEEGEHAHEEPELAPGSRDGHYHVYLDSARDDDPHVTDWHHHLEYELPLEIAPGTHTLRVELRDNDHQSVGIDDIVFFTVE